MYQGLLWCGDGSHLLRARHAGGQWIGADEDGVSLEEVCLDVTRSTVDSKSFVICWECDNTY